MEEERRVNSDMQKKMMADYDAKMAALNKEINAKKNDEEAQQEARDREAKLRIEMEFKLEQEKLKAAKEESERQERIRREEAAIKNR